VTSITSTVATELKWLCLTLLAAKTAFESYSRSAQRASMNIDKLLASNRLLSIRNRLKCNSEIPD
jgi:hypothetical protein